MAEKITMGANGKLNVPNNPTIPFIEGDGIGPDIWKAAVRVFDAAVQKAYGGEKKIEWMKVLAWQVLDWNEPAINFYKKIEGVIFDKGWVNYRLEME